MTVNVKDGGTWKSAAPYVNDAGTWKAVKEVWVKDGTTWKLAFTAQFSPAPGSYSDGPHGAGASATFTITSTTGAVVWNWTKTNIVGTGGTSDVANGGSASSITFTLTAGTTDRQCRFSVTVGSNSWTIDLFASGSSA